MSSLVYSDAYARQVRRVLPDLIRSRGLIYDLVSKDLRARYRNTVVGFMWTVLQPLAFTLILTFVFTHVFAGRAAGLSGDHPMIVHILCGLVFWQMFATSVGRATSSLLDNHDLVKKAYFPREVMPLASMGICIVNGIIGFLLFMVVRIWLEGGFGWNALWTPVIFLIQLILTTGIALLCAYLNVYYRDVGYIVEVALTFGFYATPIFYSIEQVSAAAGNSLALKLYMLNPMVGIISSFRQVLLDNRAPSLDLMLYPLAIAVIVLLLGIVMFRRNAATIADHL
ncbi:MAG: ABC transporter permease [Candidatus Hydrogenedentes bacterium]|nr:ABC transporter permease [Candidatus Hydrogenedentota bacterium]